MKLHSKIAWLVILSAGLLLVHACRRNTSPTDISADDKPPAPVRCPQTQIPWPSLADTPWPMWRHDPQQTGRSQYAGPLAGQLVWAANPVTTWELTTSVFFDDEGNVYYTAGHLPQAEIVSLYNDGSERWRYHPIEITMQVIGNCFIFNADSTISFLGAGDYPYGDKICFLDSNGEIVRSVTLPGYARRLNIDKEGNYYFTTWDGRLNAMKPDGTVLWSEDFDTHFWIENLPVFSPDGLTLYIGGGDSQGLYAISTSGVLQWTNPLGGSRTSNGIMVDNAGIIYFSPDTYQGGIFAVNPDGSLKWSFISDTLQTITTPVIGPDGYFYLPAQRSLVSLDYEGDFRWSCPYPADVHGVNGNLTCDNEGTVYLQSTYGWGSKTTVFAIDSTGQLKWSWESPFGELSSTEQPTIDHNGRLYCVANYRQFVYTLE